MKLYRVTDTPPGYTIAPGDMSSFKRLGSGQPRVRIMARRIGEFRSPKAGEYYLSGAVPLAWRAPNDFTVAYHICELVQTKRVETEHVIEVLDNA